MADAETLPIKTAPLLRGDEDALLQWSTAHLQDCEIWLSRRRLDPVPPDLLGAIRRSYLKRERDAVLKRVLADLASRRSGTPAIHLTGGGLARIAARMSQDLALYRASMRAGGFGELRLVVVERTVIPLYLAGMRELFLPRWLVSRVPQDLFEPCPLFPVPPKVTTSWLFFQSLVLATDRTRALTLAQFYDIRESD